MVQMRPQPIPTKHHIWSSYPPPPTIPSPCDGEMGIHHPNYVIKPEVRYQECVFFWTPLQGPGVVNRGTLTLSNMKSSEILLRLNSAMDNAQKDFTMQVWCKF